MSWWPRIANVFRADHLSREIDEELQSHVEEAIEQGRDPAEARRAFGSALRMREESREVRLIAWLDSLRADAIFGWRQLMKRKVTSAAAILSLALAIGACTSAFRLIDALLLRPLPVSAPERRVTAHGFSMVFVGALGGLALGFASVRYIESLLYDVKPTDPRMLALPALTILAAALLAALPPVIRAVRIDPAKLLRAE